MIRTVFGIECRKTDCLFGRGRCHWVRASSWKVFRVFKPNIQIGNLLLQFTKQLCFCCFLWRISLHFLDLDLILNTGQLAGTIFDSWNHGRRYAIANRSFRCYFCKNLIFLVQPLHFFFLIDAFMFIILNLVFQISDLLVHQIELVSKFGWIFDKPGGLIFQLGALTLQVTIFLDELGIKCILLWIILSEWVVVCLQLLDLSFELLFLFCWLALFVTLFQQKLLFFGDMLPLSAGWTILVNLLLQSCYLLI